MWQQGNFTKDTPHRPCRIWLTLEGPDIIEMRQVMIDRDIPGTVEFFQRVVVPQVRDAARRRGISIDEAEQSGSDGGLSG